jgi:transcriptional regulator with XRE-family HTH domain
METNYFATNLKYLRQKHNMEQLELAHRLGRKSSSSISEWEKGRYTPKAGILNDIAAIFNIPLSKLMNENISSTPETTLDKINNISNQLSEPRQQVVLETATIQLKEQKEEEKKNANVIPLKKKRLTDEELWEVVEHGVANDGSEQTEYEKQFFFNLLREHLDNDDEYED